MAVSFAEIKNQVLLVLYDYMLTSEEDAFWYSVAAIRERLDPEISGAFTGRAVDALVASKDLERGHGDQITDLIYALSDKGITAAENLIKKRGVDLTLYAPAPTADRILSNVEDAEFVFQINSELTAISTEIRENNEVAVILGDSKDLISSEIMAGQMLAKQSRFRLKPLISVLLPSLRFLASRFAGDGVGELAKQLIKLLFETS